MNFLRSITTVFQLYVLNAKLTYIVECLRINDRRVRKAEKLSGLSACMDFSLLHNIFITMGKDANY